MNSKFNSSTLILLFYLNHSQWYFFLSTFSNSIVKKILFFFSWYLKYQKLKHITKTTCKENIIHLNLMVKRFYLQAPASNKRNQLNRDPYCVGCMCFPTVYTHHNYHAWSCYPKFFILDYWHKVTNLHRFFFSSLISTEFTKRN